MLPVIDVRNLTEREMESASTAYLLTLMVVMVGLPLPIINLIACIGYYFSIKTKSFFVRFHAMQAMTSQAFIIIMNSVAVSWTLKIIFSDTHYSKIYVGYVATVVLFNLADYVANIIAATKARKGKMFQFFFFGTLSYLLTKKYFNAPAP